MSSLVGFKLFVEIVKSTDDHPAAYKVDDEEMTIITQKEPDGTIVQWWPADEFFSMENVAEFQVISEGLYV